MATSPRCAASSASCSSGQHFASGFLQIRSRPRHPCLQLTLPLAGCVEDFHLQVARLTTTVNPTAPVTALRAMPGAPKKNPLMRVAQRCIAQKSNGLSVLRDQGNQAAAVSGCLLSRNMAKFFQRLEHFHSVQHGIVVTLMLIDQRDRE